MPKIKNIAMLSIAALVVQFLLSRFLYPLVLGQTTQQLFSIQPYSGIGGEVIGNKLLGYLTGIIPIADTWTFLISMFAGVFVLLWAGMWIYEQNWAWKGRNLTERLFAILLYGHVILYIALLLLKWGTVTNLTLSLGIGLGINLILVAGLVALSANKLKFPRV